VIGKLVYGFCNNQRGGMDTCVEVLDTSVEDRTVAPITVETERELDSLSRAGVYLQAQLTRTTDQKWQLV